MTMLLALPIQAEHFIAFFRGIGIIAAILAVLTIIRLATLSNNLTLKKAKMFLEEGKQPHKPHEEPILLLQKLQEEDDEEQQEQPVKATRKQLLAYTLAPDAQTLLDKISVKPTEGNGWKVSL